MHLDELEEQYVVRAVRLYVREAKDEVSGNIKVPRAASLGQIAGDVLQRSLLKKRARSMCTLWARAGTGIKGRAGARDSPAFRCQIVGDSSPGF